MVLKVVMDSWSGPYNVIAASKLIAYRFVLHKSMYCVKSIRSFTVLVYYQDCAVVYREVHKDDRHEEHEHAKQQANVEIKRSKRLTEDNIIQFKLSERHHQHVR